MISDFFYVIRITLNVIKILQHYQHTGFRQNQIFVFILTQKIMIVRTGNFHSKITSKFFFLVIYRKLKYHFIYHYHY
jgi:hypothetical protein